MTDSLAPTLLITVRDDTMRELAILDGWLSFDADIHEMAAGGTVGDGRIVVASTHPALTHLIDLSDPADARATGGIVVRRIDPADPSRSAVVVSGPVTEVVITAEAGTATISWVPDDAIFAGERAFVDPTTDVPTTSAVTSASEFDTRTGSAGAVAAAYVAANMGPAAGIVRRRYPWLVVPSTGSLSGVGTAGTWQARDESLLELLVRVAAGTGISWSLRQASKSTVAFTVRAPSTVPVARYSTVAGTVTGGALTLARRGADEYIVGGGGDGTARVRTRRVGTVIPAGRLRSVQWALQGSSTDLTELRQAADEALADDAAASTATFQLTEVPGRTPLWGLDWELGDVLSVAVQGPNGLVPVQQRCVAVRVTQGPGDAAPTVTPQIGSRDAVGQITEAAATRSLVLPLTRR